MFEDMTIGVESRVGDAVAGLTLVGERLDELGDEADDAADETSRLTTRLSLLGPVSASASGGLGTLAATSAGLAVSLGTLAAAGTAALTPILAIGGAGGALAALAATGAVGHMAALNHELSVAKTEIREILEPLGDEFAPFLLTAVRRSDDLIESVVASIGPLGEFKETLRLIGAVGEEQLPKVTGAFFQLARENQDELRGLVAFLGNNAPGAIRALGDAAEEVGPETAELGLALADLGPDALEFAVIAGEELIPAVTWLVRQVDGALETFNEMPDSLQDATVWAMTLAGAIGVLSTAMGGLSRLPLGGLLTSLRASMLSLVTTAVGAIAGSTLASIVATAVAAVVAGGVVTLALEKAGILDEIRRQSRTAGEQTRETVGGETSDKLLAGAASNPTIASGLALASGINSFVNLGDDEGFQAGVTKMEENLRGAWERTRGQSSVARGPIQQTIFDNVVIQANSRAEGRAARRGLTRLADETRAQNVEGTSSGRSP